MPEKSRAVLRENRSQRTRQKIYDVAMELFQERGFDNVKVTDICDAANVSIGSFYHFYASKEALLLTYSDAVDRYLSDALSELEFASAAEALQRTIALKLTFLTHSGIDICQRELIAGVNHQVGSSLDIDQDLYEKIRSILDHGVESGEFAEGLDVRQATSSLRYILGGLFLRWCFEGGSFDILAEAQQEVTFFIERIRER